MTMLLQFLERHRARHLFRLSHLKAELMVASIQDRSLSLNGSSVSLRKQPTFHEVATRHA